MNPNKKKYKIKSGGYLKKKEKLKLTEKQILCVVKHWYLYGFEFDIWQNEDGEDLEEVTERRIDLIFNQDREYKQHKKKVKKLIK